MGFQSRRSMHLGSMLLVTLAASPSALGQGNDLDVVWASVAENAAQVPGAELLWMATSFLYQSTPDDHGTYGLQGRLVYYVHYDEQRWRSVEWNLREDRALELSLDMGVRGDTCWTMGPHVLSLGRKEGSHQHNRLLVAEAVFVHAFQSRYLTSGGLHYIEQFRLVPQSWTMARRDGSHTLAAKGPRCTYRWTGLWHEEMMAFEVMELEKIPNHERAVPTRWTFDERMWSRSLKRFLYGRVRELSGGHIYQELVLLSAGALSEAEGDVLVRFPDPGDQDAVVGPVTVNTVRDLRWAKPQAFEVVNGQLVGVYGRFSRPQAAAKEERSQLGRWVGLGVMLLVGLGAGLARRACYHTSASTVE